MGASPAIATPLSRKLACALACLQASRPAFAGGPPWGIPGSRAHQLLAGNVPRRDGVRREHPFRRRLVLVHPLQSDGLVRIRGDAARRKVTQPVRRGGRKPAPVPLQRGPPKWRRFEGSRCALRPPNRVHHDYPRVGVGGSGVDFDLAPAATTAHSRALIPTPHPSSPAAAPGPRRRGLWPARPATRQRSPTT